MILNLNGAASMQLFLKGEILDRIDVIDFSVLSVKIQQALRVRIQIIMNIQENPY